jgi:ATP-dependent protease ClpP protease subunit
MTRKIYISFSADINQSTTEQLMGTVTDLINKGFNELYFLFSTPGGMVANGIVLYNFLKGLPVDTTIHNIGNVDSIGNAIFLAGKKRVACSNSTFMFHGVGISIHGNLRLEEKNLRENLDSVLADQRKIGSIITKETSLKSEQVDTFFREATTKDADFALANGIISEIREVSIESGIPIVQLVFQR